MGTIRAWIEGFLRGRYSLADLLGPRASFARVLAVPVLIGALLVAGWLLIGPLLTIPRFTTEGPVVRNGTAVIVACGEKRGIHGIGAAMKYAHEPATGGWWNVRKGECTVWYHRPPGLEQRLNRQERAANLSSEARPEMRPQKPSEAEGAQRSQAQFQKLPVVEKLPAAER